MSFKWLKNFFSPKSVFLSFILIIFGIGLFELMLEKERNGCHMTFMFQVPQFILIRMKNRISSKYPNYNLYAYGEGHYAQSLRDGHFIGAPVVFVPGNGGSHKQVRSLGSVAQRMSDKYSTPFQLNYFTIDFNEEYSAVNSFKLEDQTIFLKESVIRIIDLYKKRGRDVSLVLIGHSVGGLIIRALLSLPEFQKYMNKIDFVITLATPHRYPVVPMDSKMIQFYRKVNQYWNDNRNQSLSHIWMLSIGGGFNDKLVRSELTRLESHHKHDINIISSDIDDVWVSTDHRCIVWCKQLVIKITRLVFDLIDDNSLKIIEDKDKMGDIIWYHLNRRTLTKSFPNFFVPQFTILSPNGIWTENHERNIKIYKPKILEPNYILLPLIRRESIVIQMEGLYRHDWLMACSATKRNDSIFCEKGQILHPSVQRLPSSPHDFERRIFKQMSSLLVNKGFSHLLLALSPSVEPVNIQIDRFTTSIRSKTILMPTLVQSLSMIFSSVKVLNIAISEETTFYNLSLIGLNHVWNTYWISFDTISCYTSASNIGYLYLTIPWSNEIHFRYVFPKKGQSSEMSLKLNSPKPKNYQSSEEPTLYLLVDPNCSYELHLKPSVSEIVEQILRHFGVILLPMIVSILLSLLSEQIRPKKVVANQITAQFSSKTKQFYEQSVNLMKSFRQISIYGALVLSSITSSVYSNYSGINSVTSDLTHTQLIVLYLFLYLISHSICYLFLVIISSIIILFSFGFDYILNKFVSNKSENKPNKSFNLRITVITTSLLITILGFIFVTPLVFIMSLVAHTLQLLHLCKRCRSLESRFGATLESSLFNVHLTLLMLLFVSTVPTIPLLLDWLNLKMPVLYLGNQDTYRIPALLTSMACAVIWHQYSATDIREKERTVLSILLKIMAILSSICCQINYWNICLMISISLFVLSAHQSVECLRNRNLKCD